MKAWFIGLSTAILFSAYLFNLSVAQAISPRGVDLSLGAPTGPCNDGIDNDGDGAVDGEDDSGAEVCNPNGETFYVSSTLGNDSYDGLAPIFGGGHGPKATLNGALSLIQSTNPGDQVRFRSNESWNLSGTMTIDHSASGAPGLVVTIGKYGTGDAPTIIETQLGATLLAVRNGSDVQRAEHIVFDGLKLTNSNPDNTDRGTGVAVTEGYAPYLLPGLPSYITFRNMRFEHLRMGLLNYGINTTIENSHFEDNLNYGATGNTGEDCLFSDGDGLSLLWNTFIRCGHSPNFFTHAVYLSGDNISIENNTIRDSNSGAKLTDSSGTKILTNLFQNNSGADISVGCGVGGPVENLEIDGNRFDGSTDAITIKLQHADQGAFGGTHNVRITNNIFSNGYGEASGAYTGLVRIEPDLSMSDIYFGNNLFHGGGNEPDLVVNYSGIQNLQLVNNIFFKPVGSATNPFLQFYALTNLSQVTMFHNGYWHPGGDLISFLGVNYSNLATFRNAFPTQEIGSIQANPKFRTRVPFQLQSSSPMVDVGEILPWVNHDFLGNPRPIGGGQDMGAFER